MFEASSHMPSAVVSRRDLSLGFASLPPIDVRKIWSVLWRGKITILLSMMIAVALAAAFVLLVPHKYTAQTQILIDPMDLRGAAQSDISPTIPQSDAAVLQVESQARVIASDNVLRRVVDSEGLDHDPEFMHGAMAQQYGSLAALNELQKYVQVKRSERTYVVDVSVTSEDPAKAARIANAIAQTYLTEQTEVRSNAARQISQSLMGRLKELQTRVRDAEQKVEAYKASHNIVGANGELVNEQQLTSLNAQLSASRARISEAKARLDQVESVLHSKTPIGAFPEAVQSQTITMLRSQYAEIMRRAAEQKSSLGERHPAVIEIEAQGARLQTAPNTSTPKPTRTCCRARSMRSRTPRSAPMNRWSACASSSATCRQAARFMNRIWSAPAKPASKSRSIPRTFASSPRPTGRCTAARRRRA